jgi:hypothetical protein
MGYISLLIIALLVSVLAFIGFKPRVQTPLAPQISETTQTGLKEQGENAIGYQDLLSSVRSQVGEVSKADYDRVKQYEDLK